MSLPTESPSKVLARQMPDKKQVVDLAGVGGYIRREKLENLLEQKHGRKIEVTVLTDSYVFYAPEEPTESELNSIKEKKRVVLP